MHFTLPSLPSNLAQCQLNMGKLFLECLIHVFFQVRWFYVFNNSCLEERNTFVYDLHHPDFMVN